MDAPLDTQPPAPSAPGVSLDDPLARVVLVEPEIPNNTGNIGRTCVAMGAALHLVHPLGFDIDEKACRRAGLDYWPRLDLTEHASFEGFERAADLERTWYLSARATRSVLDAPIARGDRLVFGRESVGLDASITERHADRCVSVPIVPGERSLNLSTSVACVLTALVVRLRDEGSVALDGDGRLRTGSREQGSET